MKLEINDFEKDTIREIVSIGLAKSGDSLASISGDKVLLTVPEVYIIESDKLDKLIAKNVDAEIIIESDLRGDLGGKCILLFNNEQIQRLSKACLKNLKNMTNEVEMKISLLLEVSNILTGALVTQLANILKLDLHGSPPDYILVNENLKSNLSSMQLFADMKQIKPFVFIIKTHFINSDQKIELPLLLIFDLESFQKILKIIREKIVANNKYIKPVS